MRRTWHRCRLAFAVAALALAAASPALATNTMYLAGYGTEAAGRAGAGIAVADRALGLQFNPAGIAQLQGNHYSVDLQILLPKLHLSNYQGSPIQNEVDAKNRKFYMPSVAYVRGSKDSPWAYGIGLVSQGGMGATFKNQNTAFGTRDETFTQVRFASLTPCVAYAVNKDLSFGLSANVGWSDLEYRFWPQSSAVVNFPPDADPANDTPFPGQNMTQAVSSFSYSFRAGAMWRVHPKVQLGATYQTKTQSDYDGGKLVANFSALGLGDIAYDAEIDGFTWPEQYGVGIQLRPAERFVLAFDIKRYLWSDAIDVITVKASNPNLPGLPPPLTNLAFPFQFNWKDQTVYALGGEWRASDAITLRAGYNYAKSAVPDDTLSPLFPAIPEKHLAAGLGWNVGAGTFNFALERAFEKSQTNNNTNPFVNPFGPGARVDHSQWTIAVGYSRAFGRN
jgi:long-chain fatty acid transport protein